MAPAIGRDHRVPAVEASVRLVPTEDFVPSHVQVNVKESVPRERRENCLGISLESNHLNPSRSAYFDLSIVCSR
jgi:hypothetical protein